MKKILLAVLVTFGIHTQAQVTTVACNMMSLSVASADTGMVNLYHPGNYLIHPQSENYIAWEITDSQGNIIAQDTLVEESHFLFYHNSSLTDTMKVTAHLWNDSAMYNDLPVSCIIEDQLYWEITEVIAGTFIGNWDFLNNSVGVYQNNVLDIHDMVLDNKGSIKIVDLLGRETKVTKNEPLLYIYDDGAVEKRIIIE